MSGPLRTFLQLFDQAKQPRDDVAVTWADACDVVLQHTSLHYEKATVLAIFGSVASGRQTPRSDIDVVVVDDTARGTLREQVVVSGRMLQIMILSSATAIGKLNAARSSANVFFPEILVESAFVAGDRPLLDLLKRSAAVALDGIRKAGFAKEGARLACRIANAIQALSKHQTGLEYSFLVEQLASRFREFVLTKAGRYAGHSASEIAIFRELLGGYATRFESCYLAAIRSGEPADLCDFVWASVSDSGYVSWETKGPIPF